MSDAVPLGGGRCLIIGEAGLAHDGSLGLAHAFVDAVADAGADAVKFQTHLASAESTPAEPFRVRIFPQDATRYDYWRRTAFAEEEWHGLARHARDRGILFLSSPFSVEAVELLARVGVPLWKIASGEVANGALLGAALETRRPIVLSSGMSPVAELDAVVSRVRAAGVPVAVLQCTTAYPCPPERIGLNLLAEFRERYGCPVGLSDHSGTIYPGLAAATLGADILEVHVTLSRRMFGPDVVASVTVEELRQLVDGVRFVERMRAHPVSKDEAARDTAPMRALFTRSVVTRGPLAAGATIRAADLALKKPGTGLPPERLAGLVGRRLRRDVGPDCLIGEDDLEPEGSDPPRAQAPD